MSRFNLQNLSSLSDELSAIAIINANNDLLEAALDTLLSKEGTAPNSMSASIDMDSNRLFNLPAAIADTEPVRRKEFIDGTLGSFDLRLDELDLGIDLDSINPNVILSFASPQTYSYTKPPLLTELAVLVWGGGGGGGGIQGNNSNAAAGSGGGAGGCAISILDASVVPDTSVITVGAKGAGGAATGGNGGSGQSSSFSTLVVATGGEGGRGRVASGTLSSLAAGDGGQGQNGNFLNLAGNGGSSFNYAGNGADLVSGQGGAAPLLGGATTGGTAALGVPTHGKDAFSPGAGGAGAVTRGADGSTGATGGDGAHGLVILIEIYSLVN